MKWWEERKHILAREYKRLNEEWLDNGFEFYIKDGVLWLGGTLKLPWDSETDFDFDFELRYPQSYPFSVPYVYPKDRSKSWVGDHQFKSSAFCLDIRDKTWNSTMTSVDILKSLSKLLIAAVDRYKKKKDKLDVYEEEEPTRLDRIRKKIRCIIPFPFDFKSDQKIGSFSYFTRSDQIDNRVIITPIVNKENLSDFLESDFFKIWYLKSFSDKEVIWIKTSMEKLESIVFKENQEEFKEFLESEELVSQEDFSKFFDKKKYIVFFDENNPVLLAEIKEKDKKIDFFGCYKFDLSSLYSRLPSTDKFLSNNKSVTIIGCGSLGSYIAEELVKSGVEKLLLIDEDFLEIENIIRHSCDIKDVGLHKTKALKNKLISINPNVEISCIETTINVIESNVDNKLKQSDLIVNATGDIEEIINEYCWQNKIVSIYCKVYPLGFGGEIIRIIPGITPCYECMNVQLVDTIQLRDGFSEFPSNDFINYNETIEGEIYSVPSLSVDVRFISLFAAKTVIETLITESLESLKVEPNIILWGNNQEWIFSQKFECLKIQTDKFSSFQNCIVCKGNGHIEEELGMDSESIDKFCKEIKIETIENKDNNT